MSAKRTGLHQFTWLNLMQNSIRKKNQSWENSVTERSRLDRYFMLNRLIICILLTKLSQREWERIYFSSTKKKNIFAYLFHCLLISARLWIGSASAAILINLVSILSSLSFFLFVYIYVFFNLCKFRLPFSIYSNTKQLREFLLIRYSRTFVLKLVLMQISKIRNAHVNMARKLI